MKQKLWREHRKEYERDEYEYNTLHEEFDNVRKSNMNNALNETLKEI